MRLGGREHRVERQAAAEADEALERLAAQAITVRAAALVLPADDRCDRRAGAAVPQNHGFTLVAEPDRHHVPRRVIGQTVAHSTLTLRQISSASCSTQPGCGRASPIGTLARAATAPSASTRMHLVALVPWSIASTNGPRGVIG